MNNENNGWIRVKDNPPPYDEDVLIYDKKSNSQIVAAFHHESDDGDYSSISWDYWDNRFADDLEPDYYEITHWQPLPKPPSE